MVRTKPLVDRLWYSNISYTLFKRHIKTTPMKKALLILFAVIGIAISASAQTYTQKWNDLYDRWEYHEN